MEPGFRVGDWQVQPDLGTIRRGEEQLQLEPKVMEVLVYLARHPGDVLPKEKIIRAVWPDTFVTDEVLTNAISELRKAFGDDAKNPIVVQTLPRRGYRLVAKVAPSTGADGKGGRGRPPIWLFVTAGTLTLAAAVWFFRGPTGEAPSSLDLRVSPLTSYPGGEYRPSFSPDGSQVAFDWSGESQDNRDIYVKQIGVEPPVRLTTDPAHDFGPAWSPDGSSIAFLRYVRATQHLALVVIPQRGGRERMLVTDDLSQARKPFGEGPPKPGWTPDSKWVACPLLLEPTGPWVLYLISVETGEKRRLTEPPEEFREERADEFWGDTAPAFSPDGRLLLFSRQSNAKAELLLLRLDPDYGPSAEPRKLADAAQPSTSVSAWFMHATWLTEGREFVFSNGSGLWRMAPAAAATPERLAFLSEGAESPSVAPRGNRLAYQIRRRDWNVYRVALDQPGNQVAVPARLIASTRQDGGASYSPDGRRIAFWSDRSGNWEIWICDSDGAHAMQLTALAGSAERTQSVRWSPDGRNLVLSMTINGQSSVYLVSTESGAYRRLTEGPYQEQWPNWSRDGRFVYFGSNRTGPYEIWKVAAEGGVPVQVIPGEAGADLPHESPDGEFLYYQKGWPNEATIWRVPIKGGPPTKILAGLGYVNPLWTVGKRGVYALKQADRPGYAELIVFDFTTATTQTLLDLEVKQGFDNGAAISPNDESFLFRRLDDVGSDLMLVENFR
jgi:Tol biopolymer transport system component/DNA-binding winged helix-turn-helix (wHTH) protein